MSNIEIESEALKISSYCSLIHQIIQKEIELSLLKTIYVAYLSKKIDTEGFNIYSNKHTKDIFEKSISLIQYDSEIIEDIPCILKAIDILSSNQILNINNDVLCFVGIDRIDYIQTIPKFIIKIIKDLKYFSDREILGEIIKNV